MAPRFISRLLLRAVRADALRTRASRPALRPRVAVRGPAAVGGAQARSPLSLAVATLIWAALIGAMPDAARAQSNPCAALGPDFHRAPGSDSCVRVGGAVRVDAYSGGSLSSNPGAGSTPTTSPVPAAPPAAAAPGSAEKKSAPPAATDPWRQTR